MNTYFVTTKNGHRYVVQSPHREGAEDFVEQDGAWRRVSAYDPKVPPRGCKRGDMVAVVESIIRKERRVYPYVVEGGLK